MKEPEFDTTYFQNYSLPLYSPTVSVGKPAIWSICWFYIDKRSGELVPSNGCTQGLYMMLIKKACPWLQALRHLVFSTRVWKWKKNKSRNGPPTLFKCYETKSLQPKLVGTCMPQVVVIIQNHSWKNSGQPKLLKSAPPLKKTQRLSRISPLWFPVLRNLDWQSFGRTNSCFFSWNSQNSLKPEVKQNAALFRRYAARTTALISIYSDLTIPGHLPASHTNQFWHQSYPKCVCLLGMLFTLNVFADDDFRSFESPSFITIWIDLRHFFNAIAEIVEILRIVMLAGAFAHLQALTPFKLRQEPGNLGTSKRDMATMPLQHWTKEDQDPIQLRSVMVFWQLISNLPSGLVSKERLVRNTFLVAEITRSRGEASMVKSTSIEVW